MTNFLDDTAQLLYADALDQAIKADAADSKGLSFVRKKIKSAYYWYLQYAIGSEKKQYYIGVETEDLLQCIERQKLEWSINEPSLLSLKKSVALAITSGCFMVGYTAYKVVNAVALSGLFRRGGVIVGSHAYHAYQNMLGVQWKKEL